MVVSIVIKLSLQRIIQNMPYQGVVLGILAVVVVAKGAVLFVTSQGNSTFTHSNRARNTGGPLPTERVPSWELG
jgi:hypothetical protein